MQDDLCEIVSNSDNCNVKWALFNFVKSDLSCLNQTLTQTFESVKEDEKTTYKLIQNQRLKFN